MTPEQRNLLVYLADTRRGPIWGREEVAIRAALAEIDTLRQERGAAVKRAEEAEAAFQQAHGQHHSWYWLAGKNRDRAERAEALLEEAREVAEECSTAMADAGLRVADFIWTDSADDKMKQAAWTMTVDRQRRAAAMARGLVAKLNTRGVKP